MSDQSYADRVVELYDVLAGARALSEKAYASARGQLAGVAADSFSASCAATMEQIEELFPELADRFAKVREDQDE